MKTEETQKEDMKDCKHDFKIEGSFKNFRMGRPLSAFNPEVQIPTIVFQKRCKKCGWYELDERDNL